MPLDFPTLNLNCGRKIFADEIHVGRTYAGLLEGVPNDELNERILARLPKRMQSLFGEVPVYVLPPVIERSDNPHPVGRWRVVARMPPVEIAMYFTSFSGITAEGDASHLILVWHQETLLALIADSVRIQLESLNWAEVAQDFWY